MDTADIYIFLAFMLPNVLVLTLQLTENSNFVFILPLKICKHCPQKQDTLATIEEIFLYNLTALTAKKCKIHFGNLFFNPHQLELFQ